LVDAAEVELDNLVRGVLSGGHALLELGDGDVLELEGRGDVAFGGRLCVRRWRRPVEPGQLRVGQRQRTAGQTGPDKSSPADSSRARGGIVVLRHRSSSLRS